MAKLVLVNVENIGGNPLAAANNINANGDAVETALENTLSRDGTSPNQMEAVLDMNGFRIINLGAPENDNDAARLDDAGSGGGGGGSGIVEEVIGTTNQITVNSADPAAPVLALADAVTTSLGLANSAVQPATLTAAVAPPAVVANSSAATDALAADAGKYTRFTHASPTYTFDDDFTYTEGMEFHGRYAGAGTLTLVAATGMTLTAPAYGTLVIPPNGTFTVKITSTTTADVFGVTVPA